MRARHGHPLLGDEHRPPEFGDLLDRGAEGDEHDRHGVLRVREHDDRRDHHQSDRQRHEPDGDHRTQESAGSTRVRGALANEESRETGFGEHGEGKADRQAEPDDTEVVRRPRPSDDRQDQDCRDRGDHSPGEEEARVPPHGLPSITWRQQDRVGSGVLIRTLRSTRWDGIRTDRCCAVGPSRAASVPEAAPSRADRGTEDMMTR